MPLWTLTITFALLASDIYAPPRTARIMSLQDEAACRAIEDIVTTLWTESRSRSQYRLETKCEVVK